MIEQFVNGDDIAAIGGAAILLIGDLKLRKAQGMGFTAKHAVAEVAGPEIGAQQVFAVETGVKRELNVVVERGGVRQRHGGARLTGELVGPPVDAVGSCVDGAATEAVGAQHEGGQSLELGGGGELIGLQFADAGLEAIHPAAQNGELLLELLDQALEFVGGFGDAIKAGIEQGRRFITTQRLAAFEAAIGVAGHAAIALHQVGEGLIGPVGGPDVGELGDAGDLLIACGVGVDGSQVWPHHRTNIRAGGLNRHCSQ